VAGEGSFVVTKATPSSFADGSPRKRFVFQVTMATWDRRLLQALRTFLGCGSIVERPPSRAHWQPTATFSVSSRRAHERAVVPFAQEFLLPCAKRTQFDQWHAELLEYEQQHPRRTGRSTCRVAGCSGLVRGRGLCRHHYYRATGY
jgi:hypothetical protein